MKNKFMRLIGVVLCATIFLSLSSAANAGAIRSGFSTSTLAANDDGSAENIPIGFDVDFFEATYG